MKVNVSIGDFSPLLRRPDYLFKGLRHTGVDGIELYIGVKSRWTPEYYLRLSKRYNLPIISVHQPLWAMTGLYFDEGFFTVAQRLGVHYVTCHPLPGRSLSDIETDKYLTRLFHLQEHTGIHVLIENMPQENRNKLLNLIAPLKGAAAITDVYSATRQHGLGLTLDTDHIHVARPHDEPWFDGVFKAIKNIHLSSFLGDERHQPLDKGELDSVGFLRRLQEKHYKGLITLEISAPRGITAWGYDFDCIERSVMLIHSSLDY